MKRTFAILALFTLAVAAACVAIRPADGQLRCAASGKQCPDGYYCAADNTCWHSVGNNADLAMSMDDDMAGGGGGGGGGGAAGDDLAIGSDMAGSPVVTSVVPPNGSNAGGTALTLNGLNFKTGATVMIGGAACGSVNVVSATQITCVVPAKPSAFGKASSFVTNPDALFGQFNFYYAASNVSFTPKSTPLTTGQYEMALGDFNNDNKQDLLVSNRSNAVSVLLGNGDGTFTAKPSLPCPAAYAPLAAADVNHDGKLDAIIGNISTGVLTTYLGAGDGTFTAVATTITVATPYEIKAALMNGDAIVDLIVPSGTSPGAITVLVSNGDGTYTPHAVATASANANYDAVADFNKDNKIDVANIVNFGTTVDTYLGNGDGTLASKSSSAAAADTRELNVGDVNNDGKPDVLVVLFGNKTLRTLLGNGDGTFTAAALDVSTGGHATQHGAVGDLNGDGWLDFVSGNIDSTGASVYYLLGKGDGSYNTAQPNGTATTIWDVQIADFNGDGKPDVAYSGSAGVEIDLNTSS